MLYAPYNILRMQHGILKVWANLMSPKIIKHAKNKQGTKQNKNPTIFFKNILHVMCNIHHMFLIDHGMIYLSSVLYNGSNHIISRIFVLLNFKIFFVIYYSILVEIFKILKHDKNENYNTMQKKYAIDTIIKS
jgi:hypothetical protein